MSREVKLSLVIALAMMAAAVPAGARHRHRAQDSAPGQFDYYLLSLSWSPAFCLQSPESPECNGPRRFGFIVHGLWPQNEHGWPEDCPSEAQVPDLVAQQISDLMPARKLVYHEWSAHGSCSGLDPAEFFALVRRAYRSVIVPAPLFGPSATIKESPSDIVDAFLRSNPLLPAQSVVATCSSQGTPRLREVHVCFDRGLNPRTCSSDALREGCRASTVIVPPVR